MGSILEVLVLAVLLLIAAELYVISRELFRLGRSLPPRLEGKEGQTINVNLGQIPVGAVPAEPGPAKIETKEPEPAAAAIEAPAEEAGPEEPEPEPEPLPPPPPPRPPAGARATTSGLVALKCPKCGSENSNYRSECFNCGEKLR